MDGRGGCCIARYAPGGGGGGGGGGGPYDMSKVDRIMLRFRPIAPKPACGGSSSSGGSSPEGKDTRVRPGRGRRRKARSGNDAATAKRSCRKRRACGKEKAGDASPPRQKVTLPLLPEMPERRVGGDLGNVKAGLVQAADYSRRAADPGFCRDKAEREMRDVPKWLSFDDNAPNPASGGHFGATIAAAAPLLQPWGRPSPCVTVECVTDTLVDGKALGRTDGERRRNLERDTCPGFTSDGLGRVTWTNGALRKMVGRQEEEEDCGVWLAVREEVGARVGRMMCGAFSCRVRMEYTRGRERRAVTLPCDVWRMDGGGFAWRLDVEAALRLGR
ncbi:uncharacterized protein LOC104417097 [Eucalyptus grandis]|uniref:uncharacterized protein LOC104417097 n=1 Tax=Eucalyptus grandis TaxID=71139 RepID=UPI00192E7E30|nr:uncharacterized protein LOC104417097 [Eucalyptus grandis]